jgi:hypothetical protein
MQKLVKKTEGILGVKLHGKAKVIFYPMIFEAAW